MTKTQGRTPTLATLACAILAFIVCPGAKNGCASEEANTTLTSPVQAVGTILEHADGSVDASLVIISTASNPHKFVESAKDTVMRMPDGTFVPLLSASPGHYAASDSTNASLVYEPAGKYQFRFDLEDDKLAKSAAGGSFIGVVEAPDDEVSFEMDPPPAFAGDTSKVTWSPSSRYGLITVTNTDSGKVTYSTFDFEESQFEGDKWARLTKGGSRELSVDTFADAGNYTVSLCALKKVSDFDTSLSADLGALSGFLIGRCGEDISLAVE